jgi:hypothetical protein
MTGRKDKKYTARPTRAISPAPPAGREIIGLDSLAPEEKTVLSSIARTRKLRPLGAFSERELSRKHQVRNIRVRDVLQGLQEKGIVTHVNPAKRLWKVIRPELEHACELENLEKKWGFQVVRR